MHVGNGVVAYFARPTDLRSLVRTLRVETHTGQAAREATLIQNQVIAPLMTPPQPVNMTLRRDRLSPGSALRVTADRSRSIRRKRKGRKPKQLQDGFSLTKWQQAQSKATGKFAKEKDQPAFQDLEFLSAAYQAEDEIQPVAPSSGSDKLPPKSELEIDIKKSTTGTGRTKPRKKTMSLVDIYGFFELWTGSEVRFLGLAREKFGGNVCHSC
jgi:hypothetical protein